MGELFNALTNPLEWLATQVFTTMFIALRALITFMLENTEPELVSFNSGDGIQGNFFQDQYALMRRIALFITVPLVLIATINAMIKGGVRGVINVYLVGLPVSVFGAFVGLVVVGIAQAITQNIVDYFDASAQANLERYIADMEGITAARNLGALLMFGALFAAIIIFAVLALMLELLVREVSIYMAMLFVPLAFSAYVWPRSRSWLMNLMEFVLAMVFSKAVVVATLSLGFAAMLQATGGGAGGDTGDQVGGFIVGLAIGGVLLFAAAFAMPVLVNFALSPNTRPPLDRSGVQAANPWNSNRQFYRGQYKQVGQKVLARPTRSGKLSG